MPRSLLPVAPFLKIPEGSPPYLEGQKCAECGVVLLHATAACPACGARDSLGAVRLGQSGTLHVYSIVHRSLPGVPTPYVSAIVDLEGGGTLKGQLLDVEPDPRKIPMGMPVAVDFRVAPDKDKEGNEYLSYFFFPKR